jgi:hypothetical protein
MANHAAMVTLFKTGRSVLAFSTETAPAFRPALYGKPPNVTL